MRDPGRSTLVFTYEQDIAFYVGNGVLLIFEVIILFRIIDLLGLPLVRKCLWILGSTGIFYLSR